MLTIAETILLVLLAAGVSAAATFALIGRRTSGQPNPAPLGSFSKPSLDRPPRAVTQGTLALFDIDDLGGLNVANGYDTGDRLLNRVEDVLRRSLPNGLELDRQDSGRFAVWLPGFDIEAASVFIERLRIAGGQTYVDGRGGKAARTLSTGLVRVRDGDDAARALLHAGSALTRAKAMGGDRLELDLGMAQPDTGMTRAQVEAGIASGALCYFVQPIMDLTTNQAAGVEALLRWTRDDGQILGPHSFVDQLDRIPDHSAELFAPLAGQAAQPFTGLNRPFFLTLNISGAVIDGADSPGCRWLRSILDQVPPQRLVVEIVEHAVIARPERTAELVDYLRSVGVRVALDDFGTGLSNLDRLRSLPVDFIKIDRAFIDGLGGAGREEAILRNMVQMTRDLGIEIIAEGIEDATQAAAVSALGIRYGQGYYFGKPGPVQEWSNRIAGMIPTPAPA